MADDLVDRLNAASKARELPVGISLMEIPKVWPGHLESEAATEITQLRADLTACVNARNAAVLEGERMRLALEFYADPRRYLGPNQRAIPNDPYDPERERWYILDITKDNGDIARTALAAPQGDR
jgi:hypothetical protein